MTGEKQKKMIVVCIVSLCIIFMIGTGSAFSKDIVLSNKTRTCLTCHAQRGIIKYFENNESIEAYVETEAFKESVHKFLTCPECHSGFSADSHPKRRFRTKEQYRIKSSRICRGCHSNEQITAKPIHASLLKTEERGKAPICTDCHGSHSMTPVSGGTILSSEKEYCLRCHGFDFHLIFKSGEILPLTVDSSLLQSSAHSRLSCSDCHFGFSSEEHPQRTFKSKRDYIIASSDSCRRCHFDKYSKTLESIHYSLRSVGNQNTPVCTDCHGAHAVSFVQKDRIFSSAQCKKCHKKEFDIYATSIHGIALLTEQNRDVPVCVDCHRAHDIKNPLTLEYHEKIPQMCGKCHANKVIMGKYGLSTDVVKTYLSDFHGVTLGFYRKQRDTLKKPAKPVAVCTDCHGTHNISSAVGTDALKVKENLTKKCQKCHDNATENFPDAWLSHYEPSLKKASGVFMVNLLYTIFLPIMVAGLIVQVLLHIWRYSINR